MLLILISVVIGVAVAQHYYPNRDIPSYIKKSLHEKNIFKITPREKKRTLTNLTLTQVFDKIKEITSSLNRDAKKNGYNVDYKFRIF